MDRCNHHLKVIIRLITEVSRYLNPIGSIFFLHGNDVTFDISMYMAMTRFDSPQNNPTVCRKL